MFLAKINHLIVRTVQQTLYKHKYIFFMNKMKVAGLLSNANEAQEIEFISKICILKNRIHFLVRKDRLKKLLEQEKE